MENFPDNSEMNTKKKRLRALSSSVEEASEEPHQSAASVSSGSSGGITGRKLQQIAVDADCQSEKSARALLTSTFVKPEEKQLAQVVMSVAVKSVRASGRKRVQLRDVEPLVALLQVLKL